MLTGPLFMMQVYDRVLLSYSVVTLVALVIIVFGLFAFYGVIEALRSRIAARIGDTADARLRGRMFRAMIRANAGSAGASNPPGDLDTVRRFTGSAGVLAFLDLPWTPIYIAVVFVLHSGLGWLAVGGVAVVTVLMLINEAVTRRIAAQAARSAAQRDSLQREAGTNFESVLAMGMIPAVLGRWDDATALLRRSQATALDRTSALAASSRAVRFFLQSAVLALGAYFVIGGEMSAGAIIAGSVITARALAPIEQVIAHWRSFLDARSALTRVRAVYALPDTNEPATALATSSARLDISNVAVFTPDRSKTVLRGVSFSLRAGDILGVIGPSAAGKTTLLRAIVGVWPTAAGDVRFDGAELSQYSTEQRSSMVGYLPQKVELFDGTLAENISRFARNADSNAVIEAAKLAGVHELALSQADGYDTVIGPQGAHLSAGQRQRIGLARAVFGAPAFVLLDEPTSNLDAEGEAAFTRALHALREAGKIAIVVAHRPSALLAATHALVLARGEVAEFGSREDVLSKYLSVGASRS